MRLRPIHVLLLMLLAGGGASLGPAAAEEGDAAAIAPTRVLFPFGVRERGRPDRVAKDDESVARAVRTGLEWLAAHRAPDGHWPAANLDWCDGEPSEASLEGAGKPLYDWGVTALALSAFLSAGHTPAEGDAYASVIGEGLSWLISQQDDEGCIGPRSCQHYIYNHAFGALTLVEALGITGDARLVEPAQRALDFSALTRNPEAAWRYGVRPGDNDTSATGCVSMAFCAARLLNQAAEATGLAPPLAFDRGVFAGARRWLDRMTDDVVGRTGYIRRGQMVARPQELVDVFPGERSEACTAIAMFVRQVAPGGDEARDKALLRLGSALLDQIRPRWDAQGGYTDLFYWYYGSLALHHLGGESWTAWRHALVETLVAAQRHDLTACEYAGSWDPACAWGIDGGRIYATAMAILCLQTTHRFPTLPADREDLLAALRDEELPTKEQVRLLRAIAAYRVPGAPKAVRSLARHADAAVRGAVAEVLGTAGRDASAEKTLGRLLDDDSAAVRRAAARGLLRLGPRGSHSVASLAKALDDSDAHVRALALRALASVGPSAISCLERARTLLADPAPRVRVAAAAAVWRVGEDAATAEAPLLAGLSDSDPAVRAEAASVLFEAGAKSDAARTALTRAIEDETLPVRIAAAQGLVALNPDPRPLVKVASDGLQAEAPELRRQALSLVVRLGPQAIDVARHVVRLALAGSPDLRIRAVRAIGALGIGAYGGPAALQAGIEGGPAALRKEATDALSALGGSDDAHINSLLTSLFSTDGRLRQASIDGLAAHGRKAVKPLLERLGTKESSGPLYVLQALSALGAKASSGVPQVRAILEKAPTPAVRAEAARFLGTTGRHARDAVKTLEKLSMSGHAAVWREALRALRRIGDAEGTAVRALGRIAADTDAALAPQRVQAIRLLGTLGEKAQPALLALLKGMADEKNDIVREEATQAIASLGRPALDALKRGITDRDATFRMSVFDAIGRMGEDAKKLIPDLVEAIGATDTVDAYEPARALAGIGKPALRALRKLLSDPVSLTRTAAAWALGLMGSQAKPAIRDLKRLEKDPVEGVRTQARIALERIG